MTEREHRLYAFLVSPTVAHEDAFLIFLVNDLASVAPCAGVSAELVCGNITELLPPCVRQFARRVGTAGKYVGNSLARRGTEEPSLHDGLHLVAPRHGDRIARYVYEHYVPVDGGKSLNQAVLTIRKTVFLAVMTLRILIVTFIKTAEEHHAVGVLCLLHRLSYKFMGSAGLVKPLLGNDSVVLANGIAHISTGIIYPYLIAETIAHSLYRERLTLRLQRGASASDGHHLYGVLTDDKHPMRLRSVERQQSAVVL